MSGLKAPTWKEALLWAVLVALLLEFGINGFIGKTLWHRMTALERKVKELEQIQDQQKKPD